MKSENRLRLSTIGFPEYARNICSSDVRDYWFEREGNEYTIYQLTNRVGTRLLARVWAQDVTSAKRELFKLLTYDLQY